MYFLAAVERYISQKTINNLTQKNPKNKAHVIFSSVMKRHEDKNNVTRHSEVLLFGFIPLNKLAICNVNSSVIIIETCVYYTTSSIIDDVRASERARALQCVYDVYTNYYIIIYCL